MIYLLKMAYSSKEKTEYFLVILGRFFPIKREVYQEFTEVFTKQNAIVGTNSTIVTTQIV